jgi:hypothetical protein
MTPLSIVDIGKYLQKHGLDIGEHPAFGGVGGGHSPTGYHPVGQAIDVRDWRPDMAPAYKGGEAKPWKQRTSELSWRAKQLGLFNEALGPGDKGHDTHVHLALEGSRPISQEQLEWLATGRRKTPEGTLTDAMPAPPAPQLPGATAAETNEKNTNQLMSSLVGEQPSLKDMLLAGALQKAMQRKQETMNQFMQPIQSAAITPQQAMELFS